MLEDAVPMAAKRLRDLASSDDERIAHAAVRTILEWGLTKTAKENPFQVPDELVNKPVSEQIAWVRNQRDVLDGIVRTLETKQN